MLIAQFALINQVRDRVLWNIVHVNHFLST